ncbi:MAG TPA: ornithine cyclodeaminase family protein [Streptosporangiaceae bacterium]|nr:ornithine cyclodeaminase family protein [Streptosporangiaceae bacterium]
MELLVLPGGAVRSVLSYPRCAEAMRAALTARARGEVFQPLRSILKPEGAAGLMGLMPSYQAGIGYGLKAINITPGNPAVGLDTHQGVVLLSDQVTGKPLAVLNASAVTEIRTAAVSAVATEELAAPGSDVLAIVGTGVQARSHLMAIASTLPLAEVRIAGSAPAKAAKFAADIAPAALAEVGAAVRVTAFDSVRAAVEVAHIVVTATSSATPVLEREWLAPGTHINAVGACLPHTRELDTPTVAGAALFGDSRDSVLAESGDYLLAAAEGAIGPDHIRAEIGDLLAGIAPGQGRRDASEITIFESLGQAIEDLAAAMAAYQAARESGEGNWIEFD